MRTVTTESVKLDKSVKRSGRISFTLSDTQSDHLVHVDVRVVPREGFPILLERIDSDKLINALNDIKREVEDARIAS